MTNGRWELIDGFILLHFILPINATQGSGEIEYRSLIALANPTAYLDIVFASVLIPLPLSLTLVPWNSLNHLNVYFCLSLCFEWKSNLIQIWNILPSRKSKKYETIMKTFSDIQWQEKERRRKEEREEGKEEGKKVGRKQRDWLESQSRKGKRKSLRI